MGISALDQLPRLRLDTPIVLELSSWQLESLIEHQLSPWIAVLTVIAEDHLNTYRDFAEYASVKRGIAWHQQSGDDEDLALIEDFIGYFEHPAYVRIDGAPLLLVYCPLELPDSRRTISRWREVCRQRGIGEIRVVAVESHELMRTAWKPAEHGYDASVEFPPHEAGQPIDVSNAARDSGFTGVVHDYRRVVEAFCTRELPPYKRFRCVMPGWDNTARRKDDPHVFVNSGPAEYQTWLEFAIEDTRASFVGDERLVFVNAWNEWAEAAYLEPDTTYGHAFLEATRNALLAERNRG
jgi:lipopolysaccharide biosynthesis protein